MYVPKGRFRKHVAVPSADFGWRHSEFAAHGCMRLSDDDFDIAAERHQAPEQTIQRILSEFTPKQPGDLGSGQAECAGQLRLGHAALSDDVVEATDEFRLQQM